MISGGPVLSAVVSAPPCGPCRRAHTLSAAARQAAAPSCDFRRAGAGRSRTRVGPGRQGPELVGLRGCGGPIGPKARRGGRVGLEHDGHLAPRNLHGLWGWPRVNLREPPGSLVVARGGVGVMVVGTFDAPSGLHRELLARSATPFGTSRPRQLPLLVGGRPGPLPLLIF